MNIINCDKIPPLPYAMEEAMNRLRVNISFLGSDVRRIMVVSSVENEGKSFVALRLWEQMAKTGARSILVDADMRKSVIAVKYDLQTGKAPLKGTSHYLAGEYPLEEAIYHTDMPAGDILPNTDNIINPSLLIENAKFRGMLDELAKKYRYVFVDVPPLGYVSDAEKIGSMCDGAILVIRSGSTSGRIVKNTERQLKRCGCPLLGVVLNRVPVSKGGYYYKYKQYGGYYGRGGYYGGDAYYYGNSSDGKKGKKTGGKTDY